MKVGPVFFLAALPALAHAQTQASLGVGVGTVRYAGGSSFSAATISPAVQVLSPSFFLGSSGTLSALPDGVWAAQGRADLWAAFVHVGAPQLALSAGGAASTRSDGIAAASATAIAELMLGTGRGGAALGAGPVSGVIQGEPLVTALRLRARSWWQVGADPTQLSLSVEPTRFLGAWYTDVIAGATVERGRVTLSLWATARGSAVYGSKGAASAAAQYSVTPSVTLEAGAGSYLSDPFQGLPRAGFVSAGVRVHAAPRPSGPRTRAPSLTPLIASRRGDSVVVRFQMDGARSVAIAGDWNAWRPAPLRPMGGDIWEGTVLLAAGTYHFSLLVDGKEWVVPGGVAVVSDGMGGMVAVLTVL